MFKRVGHGLAVLHADERAVLARGDVAAVRAVFVEQMAHHAQAARHVDQVGLEPDQAAHGNERLDGHFLAVMVHVGDVRLAPGKIFHDVAHGFLGNFQEQFFDRLQQIAVCVLAINDLGARDQHFVAFAAHLLDENGDLHFAAAG
jgi:hypothetical protein